MKFVCCLTVIKLILCYSLSICVPSDSHVGMLTPNVTIVGVGALGGGEVMKVEPS